jgi:hypothetical protein
LFPFGLNQEEDDYVDVQIVVIHENQDEVEKPLYKASALGMEEHGTSPDEAIGALIRNLWLCGEFYQQIKLSLVLDY